MHRNPIVEDGILRSKVAVNRRVLSLVGYRRTRNILYRKGRIRRTRVATSIRRREDDRYRTATTAQIRKRIGRRVVVVAPCDCRARVYRRALAVVR